MAQWRYRKPDSFPPDFHAAMAKGAGTDKLVTWTWTKAGLESKREQWRLFCFCLRETPASVLYPLATQLNHRTRTRFNHERQRWELLLTSRANVLEGSSLDPANLAKTI